MIHNYQAEDGEGPFGGASEGEPTKPKKEIVPQLDVADGATVPILHEGRTTKVHVRDGNDLDELFPSILAARDTLVAEIDSRYGCSGSRAW